VNAGLVHSLPLLAFLWLRKLAGVMPWLEGGLGMVVRLMPASLSCVGNPQAGKGSNLVLSLGSAVECGLTDCSFTTNQ
jgi:hypothetical protein